MSEPTRRHPNVVNLSEVKPAERFVGNRFGARFCSLGENAGARGIGCTWFEVSPGRSAMPRHWHCANEEALWVIEGRGTLRVGDATVEIGPGDWATFPVGPDHAHLVTNTGDAPLRYLALSTKQTTEVVGYPDSKKVMAAAIAPGTSWLSKPWVRHMFKEDTAVDYMEGEKIE